MDLKIHRSIQEIDEAHWDSLLQPNDSPFFRYAFLRGLEISGAATPHTGWHPRFVCLYDGVALRAALPLYRKDHSYGEYIFDWSWADAAHRVGLPYYPKLVSMAPFSPVGGRCFLGHDSYLQVCRRPLLAAALNMLESEPATGLHLLYIGQEEAAFLEASGVSIRHSFQYQWKNDGYGSFDDFLGRFRSKRRAQIRRERKLVKAAGVSTRLVRGHEATDAEVDAMWSFYASTVDQFQYSQRYLNRDFFLQVKESMGEDLLFLFAEKDGQIIAGTFNLLKNGVFYGRYWGCREQVPFLHFEMCCYAPVEYAIERDWIRVEAGAGGSHKMGRGFLPTTIRSAHELRLPGLREAVDQFIEHERASLDAQINVAQGWVFKD